MIGSILTRGLLLIFGYAYPAYECYKTVELNKPDIQQLQFWCQYWILVAGLTVCERIGDTFIGWLPMYGEAKLAFFIYLWFPKTKGTTYVYSSFFKPYIAKHETDIDRNLLELRTRAGDMAVLYWQRAASYGQTRIFDILQYIASQSTPPKPAQPQQQGPRAQKPGELPSTNKSIGETREEQSPASPSSASSSASSNEKQDTAEEVRTPKDSKALVTATTAPATLIEQKATPTPLSGQISKSLVPTEKQVMQIDSAPKENNQPRPQEVILQEATRVTRARLRKTRSK
ncbi:putative HVA22-like protein g [Andrographis paniculata]|uniref:putative HVA22-like protein g n=1 Tax=Andrographis paniculata TaxID=175694 RepID=UPI0021E7ACDB|nr:putative HVA22-like protein g [Andrographis paniculata]